MYVYGGVVYIATSTACFVIHCTSELQSIRLYTGRNIINHTSCRTCMPRPLLS